MSSTLHLYLHLSLLFIPDLFVSFSFLLSLTSVTYPSLYFREFRASCGTFFMCVSFDLRAVFNIAIWKLLIQVVCEQEIVSKFIRTVRWIRISASFLFVFKPDVDLGL